MSDLISRSELLKALSEAEDNYRAEHHDCVMNDDPFSDGILSAMFSVFQMVKSQPTAYDIDKVVEEIIEDAHNTIVDFKLNKYIYTRRAIEIVKAGVRNENRNLMSKSVDYNKLFTAFQSICNAKNCRNAFADITLVDIIDLNYLLDRLIIFCENIDTEEIEDCECGDEVLKLYKLADKLFSRDLRLTLEEQLKAGGENERM